MVKLLVQNFATLLESAKILYVLVLHFLENFV
jgi:hypothetical protein